MRDVTNEADPQYGNSQANKKRSIKRNDPPVNHKEILYCIILKHIKHPNPSGHLGQVYSEFSRSKPKHGETAFSFYVPHLWNKLPEHLRSAKTADSFKPGLKALLLTVAFQ